MAWMNKHIFFYSTIITLLVVPTVIHGETPTAVPPHFNLVNVSSLFPKHYCQSSTSGTGPTIGSQKMKLVSRFGPCSSNGNSLVGSMNKRLSGDQYRPIGESVNRNRGVYTVKIGLGTPQQNYNVMVDTGSSLTWVRCQSRTDESSTYNNTTSECRGPFSMTYNDESHVEGTYGCDALALGDSHVDHFRFGCGTKYIDKSGDKIDGILGLGKEHLSLLSQLSSNPQMFSYCIPLTSSQQGNVYFGNEAKSYHSTQFTPMVNNDEHYRVSLVGISVAGEKLNVSFPSAGTIIDSGTAITRLPRDVYSALRAEFRKSMSGYALISRKVDELMDTCYNLQGKPSIALPEIKFHFGGGSDVTLSTNGILWDHDKNVECLGFAATDDEQNSIIGNVQQRGMNVLFDVQGGRIGFGPSNCAT